MKHRGKARNSQQDCTTLQQIAEKPFRHGWDATRMRWYCTCRLTGDGKSQIQGHLPRKNQILHIQHLGIIGPVALSPQHHPRKKKKNLLKDLVRNLSQKTFCKNAAENSCKTWVRTIFLGAMACGISEMAKSISPPRSRPAPTDGLGVDFSEHRPIPVLCPRRPWKFEVDELD